MLHYVYEEMFNNNLGVITSEEQKKLKNSTVIIAGAGGVGGNVAYLLARAGIGGFVLADFDFFSCSNINRQFGANINTIGVSKIDIIAVELEKINKDISIKKYHQGITRENVEEVLDNGEVVVDAIDFLVPHIRKRLIDTVQAKGMYSFLAPALGFGASLAVFSPESLSYDDFFGPPPQKMNAEYALDFGKKIFPKIPSYVDMQSYRKGMGDGYHTPTFSISVMLASTMVAGALVLYLIGRKKPALVPVVQYVDLQENVMNFIGTLTTQELDL